MVVMGVLNMILIILIIFIILIFSIYFINKKNNFIYKIQANSKWRKIQPDIKSINEMHKRYYESNEKINWFDKNMIKSTKKEFETYVTSYKDYVNFCESKKIPLKLNQDEFETIIEETESVILTQDDALDKALERAKKRYDLEYQNLSYLGEKLFEERKKSINLISDIEELINSIAKKPKSFKVELNEIEVKKNSFQDTIDFAEEQKNSLKKCAIGMEVGIATSGVFASIAPSAAMWVATTFGTASTGTAISALSGAAASNAALAWLGGGAVATGGSGIAAGQALLALAGPIGWGIAGTSILTSICLIVRKHFKIKESKRDEVKRVKSFIEQLKEIELRIEEISLQTTSIYDCLLKQKKSCIIYDSKDYSSFTTEDKEKLATLVNNTKSLSILISKTIEDDIK